MDELAKELSAALAYVGFESSFWLGSRIRYFLTETKPQEVADAMSRELLSLLTKPDEAFYFDAKKYIDALFDDMVATGFSRPIPAYDIVCKDVITRETVLTAVCKAEDKDKLFRKLSQEMWNVCFTPASEDALNVAT